MRPLAVFGALLLAATAAAQTPNIILFLADDQGWTGTSVQMDDSIPGSRSDYYRTPALEKLAAAGMRFSNAYSAHPNCTPSRMAIQTGKSPARLGSTDIFDVMPDTPSFIKPFYDRFYVNKPLNVHFPITEIPDEEVTIAEFLKKHAPDYATAHFGKWHLNGGGPAKHGYDVHDGPTSNQEGFFGPPNPKRIDGITERSLAFIDKQAEEGKPFLLQISHYAVHTPVRARPKTIDAYKSRQGGVHTHAEYGAMTENLDESLAAIMEKLDELGLAGDTYLFYTSDNGGENTNNTPLKLGKTHTWEGGIRVPFIVRGPGIEAGSSSDAPVNGYDFFATVAEVLGVEAALPADQDGRSLASILKGGRGSVERASNDFIWYYPHYRNMKDVFPQGAMRSGDWKLVKFYETGDVHLYDLSKDTEEKNDLAKSMPDKASQMHDKLNRYLAAVNAKIPTENPDYDPKKDLGLSSEPIRFGPPRGARGRGRGN